MQSIQNLGTNQHMVMSLPKLAISDNHKEFKENVHMYEGT